MNAEFCRQFVERLALASPNDKLVAGFDRLLQEIRDGEVVACANPALTPEQGQFARGRLAMALDMLEQWDEAHRQAAALRPAG